MELSPLRYLVKKNPKEIQSNIFKFSVREKFTKSSRVISKKVCPLIEIQGGEGQGFN